MTEVTSITTAWFSSFHQPSGSHSGTKPFWGRSGGYPRSRRRLQARRLDAESVVTTRYRVRPGVTSLAKLGDQPSADPAAAVVGGDRQPGDLADVVKPRAPRQESHQRAAVDGREAGFGAHRHGRTPRVHPGRRSGRAARRSRRRSRRRRAAASGADRQPARVMPAPARALRPGPDRPPPDRGRPESAARCWSDARRRPPARPAGLWIPIWAPT